MERLAEFLTIVAGITAVIVVVALARLILLWERWPWLGVWLAATRKSPIAFHLVRKDVFREGSLDLVDLYVDINLRSKDGRSRRLSEFYPMVLVARRTPGVRQGVWSLTV
jgi:hypothetical protein